MYTHSISRINAQFLEKKMEWFDNWLGTNYIELKTHEWNYSVPHDNNSFEPRKYIWLHYC